MPLKLTITYFAYSNYSPHRIRRGNCADSEEHLADHRTHSTDEPGQEAMEPTGGLQCECSATNGHGTGSRGLVADERHGGGQDRSDDDAEHNGLRSEQVSDHLVVREEEKIRYFCNKIVLPHA